MAREISRRELIRSGATLAGLAAMGIPEWALPALAQGEQDVAFTDLPANFNPTATQLDLRTVQKSTFMTPTDKFFAVQHYNVPQVDAATYKLKIDGLVNKPIELTLDELKKRSRVEQTIGFECSGNNGFQRPLIGNARWVGTSLNALLKDAGLKPNAREIVFFAADKGTEDIVHGRGQTQKYEQNFGRSLAVEDAMKPEPFLAWEMNGAPLATGHGAPVRLIVPGWYGVANVKWLNRIHVQDARFVNRFMGRDYVTLIGRKEGDQTVWYETSVSRIRLKSLVVRLTHTGDKYTATGFVLNDGTPLKSVEVRVDEGPWKSATLDRGNTTYSWKLFTFEWTGATPGDHTIVSRVTDANGGVQPEAADLADKKSIWENNGQVVRKFKV
jgi:DMSO/TMAO reductase YedYZ molybdopterin-dependent catalytic subunit